MAEVKAIELKGIVHNATKVGVQDGQAEDIVNLRFKDGAWRSAGDGKLLNLDVSGYTNIYIHTNVYRHMLGVKNGKLWWFATASESDPNAFTAITPVEICSADVTTNITQNGNLVTVYDDSSKLFVYALYVSSSNYYKVLNADVNGQQSSRQTYPFGDVHFNYYAPIDTPDEDRSYSIEKTEDADVMAGSGGEQVTALYGIPNAHNLLISSLGEAKNRNRFTRPFLACVAVRLYDGSYAYASAPQLVWPRQLTAQKNKYYGVSGNSQVSVPANKDITYVKGRVVVTNTELVQSYLTNGKWYDIADNTAPVYSNYIDTNGAGETTHDDKYHCRINTSDLVLSIGDISILKENKDIFTDVCVFVTPEIDYYKVGIEDYKKSWQWNGSQGTNPFISCIVDEDTHLRVFSYCPPRKTSEQINSELLRSQFYLLRTYSSNEFSLLENGVIVDLQAKEYDGLLNNLVQQDALPVDAFSRSSYRPRYVYEYNGRNHFANYTNIQFHGNPIDVFNNNGYSVATQEGSYIYRVLKGLTLINNDKYQYDEGSVAMVKNDTFIADSTPYFIVRTIIEGDNGQQRVARYVVAYDPTTPKNGRLDTIHDLSPVLSFPDSRAKTLSVYYIGKNSAGSTVVKGKTFELTPAAYANVAYYMSEDLLPIKLSTFKTLTSVSNVQSPDTDFSTTFEQQQSVIN